ncbi:hypothetical protein AE02_04194, partial [Klebsiella variicola]
DKLIMRVADLVMTIPGLPLLIVAGAMLSELDFSPDSRIYMVVVMLSLLEWPRLARLVRGQCLSLRERDFMLATQVLGLSARRRLFGHLLPNTIPILVVMATMAVANAILSESALSYLGLGVLLKPQVVDFNALMAQRKAGNYDLASFSTSTLNDPHDGVWDFYSSEAKESGYHNAEVDKLINAGNAVLDIEQRKPIYHQLYKVLADDPPVILLGYRNILSASSARVSGFKPDIYNGLTGSLPDVKIVK